MTCPSCSGPLVPATISEAMASALNGLEILPRIWLALGLFDRCAECFWWRVALLLGYCAV